MEKLFITLGCFLLGIWIWNEYFRAIPDLSQQGVLNNFRVVSIEPHQATYQVLAHHFVEDNRQTIRTATPVWGNFNNLSYISNIDVLLSTPNWHGAVQLEQDDRTRCYFTEDVLTTTQRQDVIENTRHYSLIASTPEIAKQIRRLKPDQLIQIEGDFVEVHSVQNRNHQYQVGFRSSLGLNCHLLRVSKITQLVN